MHPVIRSDLRHNGLYYGNEEAPFLQVFVVEAEEEEEEEEEEEGEFNRLPWLGQSGRAAAGCACTAAALRC
jgi:hypothetical protein